MTFGRLKNGHVKVQVMNSGQHFCTLPAPVVRDLDIQKGDVLLIKTDTVTGDRAEIIKCVHTQAACD